MSHWALLGLLALLCDCSAAGDGGPYIELSLSPDAALTQDTKRALENISDATGLGLILSGQGVPVSSVPETRTKDGKPACGVTYQASYDGDWYREDQEILVASVPINGCGPAWMIIRHEILCHAMVPHGTPHTETGVCAFAGGYDTEIDSLSLAAFCEEHGC